MPTVKLWNGLLWLSNVALGAAIVVFAFQYLLFPVQDNPLEKVELDEGGGGGPSKSTKADYSPLKNVPNPVEPRVQGTGPTAVSSISADLLGTNVSTDPQWMFAFLMVKGKNQQVTAYYDEPVMYDGAPVAEFSGWKLKKVTATSATFSNGAKEETITMAGTAFTSMGPSPVGPHAGGTGERGKVTMLQRTNDREVYGVDRNTMAWAMENQEKILSEIGLQDYSSGGIQVTSIAAGSIASEAGLQQQDVIKSINGQPIANSISLAELRNNPQMKQQSQLVISIERGGQTKTIVVQPTQR